ncbi:MAG: rhodanese-like domain-containing protein [Sphingobacteriaceae bacterium]|nr:rhodanese-like domain-containing protein [Sphingobacteriaceae bacterium]
MFGTVCVLLNQNNSMKFRVTIFTLISLSFFAQEPTNPWKKEQILPTKDLADKIKTNAKDLPLILNIGPMQNIKTAQLVGAVNYEFGMMRLKDKLEGLDKNKDVVFYCGCCSYKTCPNIKPAFEAATKAGFKKIMILDLPVGIEEDWLKKGYPVE